MVLRENLKETQNMLEPGVDERIILNWEVVLGVQNVLVKKSEGNKTLVVTVVDGSIRLRCGVCLGV